MTNRKFADIALLLMPV